MLRVLDIETTGTDTAAHAVIEIASIDLVKGGGITNPMQTLVALPEGKTIPPQASAVHHILAEDLVGAPPLAEAIERFRGANAYVGHNAAFDDGFLRANGIELGPWVCTYKCALRVWPDLDSHGNQALRYHFGLSRPFGQPRHTIQPHRASSDVIVTAAIFEKLIGEAAWSDLVDWSSEPALYTKLHFGKHRGMRYDRVDSDYLAWVLRQKDMDVGVRYSAEHWLALREKAVPA